MATIKISPPRYCAKCGAELPRNKNWHKVAKARRDRPIQCQSCRSTKHGLSRSRLFNIWSTMMARCGHHLGAAERVKKHYQARGITVCKEWQTFTAFAAWAFSRGYTDELTIDRIDAHQGYCPENCQWLTITENVRRRDDFKLSMDEARKIRSLRAIGLSGKQVARLFGITRAHVYRVANGGAWAE